MTGRAAADVGADPLTPGDVLLEEQASRPDAVALRSKEVVGLAGLLGSGADRVLQRLFGIRAGAEGVLLRGAAQRHRTPPPRSAPASAWSRASGGLGS